MTTLVPPLPSLHHAVSLDQLYTLSSPHSYYPNERGHSSSNLQVQPVECLDSTESIDQRSWRIKRKMSTPNITVLPGRQTSLDTQTTARAPKPRLSLSSLIPNSRLLRRLSTSPTSPQAKVHRSTPPNALLQIQPIAPPRPRLDQQAQPRPVISRSSTMPSIGDSGWTIVEKCGTLSEEPTDLNESQETLDDSKPPHHLIHLEPQSIPRRINTSTSCLNIAQTASASAPVSPSPCQRVWLCTPPKPSTCPPCSLSSSTNSRRRPAITTRALSHASLARTFDENGAIVYVSGHSEKILTLPGVKQGVSCWREKYACCPIKQAASGLMRSQSAVPASQRVQDEVERPVLVRAETTGSIGAGKDEGGMMDSASGEPMLENGNNGRKRNEGMKGLFMGI